MSQQLQAGRGCWGGRGGRGGPRARSHITYMPKTYKSPITEIEYDTFNTGASKHAALFTKSRKNISNYIQRSSLEEGFLVTQIIRTGMEQTIEMPAPADAADADAVIVRTEQVRAIAKRRSKIDASIKRGFATLYDQCSEQVKTKLEATNGWAATQNNQELHELISKIERICVGFDDHKQEVYNLVQSMKSLMLFSQGEKETVDEYVQGFKSHWDTCSAFGGSPGEHEGLVNGILATAAWVADPDNIIPAERERAVRESTESVKAAMVISGAEKRRFGQLKLDLANDYLLGTDQYPNTLEKAVNLLANYRAPPKIQMRGQPSQDGVAFIQTG